MATTDGGGVVAKAKAFMPPHKVQVVVYHARCPDGFAAAFCCWLYFMKIKGVMPSFLPWDWWSEPPAKDTLSGRHILMLDVCFPLEYIRSLRADGATTTTIMVLDHHESAAKQMQQEPGCFFDMRRSAVGLAWEYFRPMETPLPTFMAMIQKRDLWQMDEDTRAFTTYFYNQVPYNFEQYEKFLVAQNVHRAIERGRIILSYQAKLINSAIQNAKYAYAAAPPRFLVKEGLLQPGDIATLCSPTQALPIVECSSTIFLSEAGAALATRCDQGVCLLWRYESHQDCIAVSIRCSNDSPVNAVSLATYLHMAHRCAAAYKQCRGHCADMAVSVHKPGGHAKAASLQLPTLGCLLRQLYRSTPNQIAYDDEKSNHHRSMVDDDDDDDDDEDEEDEDELVESEAEAVVAALVTPRAEGGSTMEPQSTPHKRQRRRKKHRNRE